MATETEVFELFGRVSFKAQMFECSMGTLVITMRTIVGEPFETEEEAKAYIEDVDERTLGNLLGRVRKMTKTIDGEVERVLIDGLNARNGLVHGFFVRHSENKNVETPEGHDKMIEELLNRSQTIRTADELAHTRIEYLHAEFRKIGLMKAKD